MLYCGSEGGYIYLWDLRGGKNSAFVSSAKVSPRDMTHVVFCFWLDTIGKNSEEFSLPFLEYKLCVNFSLNTS